MDKRDEEIDAKQYSFKLNPALAESIVRFSQQMSQATKNMGLVIQSIGETYGKFIESISPALTKFVLQYQEYLKLKNISTPFNECGLWLTPSMTPGIVMIVVQKYEQGGKRAIPAILEGFYRRNNYENLRRAVDSWSSYEFFSPRMHIFRDALDAHIAGKWTLTVPTLLPHIEGIAGEILLASKLPFKGDSIVFDKGYKTKTYPSSLFGNLAADKVTPTMDIMISSLLDYLEGTLYAYKSFKDYPKIRRLPKLNRHAILHGYQVNYATRLNSLRCFLALDSLSMLKGNIPKLV